MTPPCNDSSQGRGRRRRSATGIRSSGRRRVLDAASPRRTHRCSGGPGSSASPEGSASAAVSAAPGNWRTRTLFSPEAPARNHLEKATSCPWGRDARHRQHMPLEVRVSSLPQLAKVDHAQYSSEKERIAALSNPKESAARASALNFSFNFG